MSDTADNLNPTSQLLIYQATDGNIKIDVRLDEETVWLSQEQMAMLFGKGRSTITEHIQNIFTDGELNEKMVCRDFRQTTQHGAVTGKTQEKSVKHYNLDVIISVGYRVKSKQVTQFRIWATQRLKEYIVKGFSLNSDRFKSGNSMNYFDELQNRIREIRISERFFYQKIKDIYTTSIDYDPKDEKTIEFFKIVQNKLIWALVEKYLAFAETMAQQKKTMYMKDWIERLDVILHLNGRELLTHARKSVMKRLLKKQKLSMKNFR